MKEHTEEETVSVYQFDDYRQYLTDKYHELLAAEPDLSCRVFAARAGFSNPGFFNDVIKGRRKLSPDAVAKVVAVFSLSAPEADYFRLLVSFAHEKNCDKRAQCHRKMIARRNRSSFVRIDPAITRYYQDFRYPLIRTAVMACRFTGDCDVLAKFIYPSIPPSVIQKCVADLEAWGIITRGSSGVYRVVDRFLEPPETMKDLVRQMNREWILHAADALMKVPAEKRNMSSMLLALSPAACKLINEKIGQLRDEVWNLVRNDTEDPSCVMQMNIQYFPRSRTRER
jgi:uncharacterized protein (TIGR02147 family)